MLSVYCYCLCLVHAATRTRVDPGLWLPGCCWRGLCHRPPRCSPGAAAAPARRPWAPARPWRWSSAPQWESLAAALPPRGPRWSTEWCPAGRAARSSGTRCLRSPGSLWRPRWSRTDSAPCGTAASCRSATASPSRSHLEEMVWKQQTAEGARGHFLLWLWQREFVEVFLQKLLQTIWTAAMKCTGNLKKTRMQKKIQWKHTYTATSTHTQLCLSTRRCPLV